ncbi:MAG: outer membrane protein OmpAb [Rhizobacter sp.]|nr:outer membrane protein OmpAb [Rhizobacter sp.]
MARRSCRNGPLPIIRRMKNAVFSRVHMGAKTRSWPGCAAMVLAAVSLWGAASPVFAADVSGSKDHPLVSRFAGARIVDYRLNDFDEVAVPKVAIGAPGKPASPDSLLKIAGKVTRIGYAIPANKKAVEVMRNYEQALGASFKTVFGCAGNECGHDMSTFIGMDGKVIPSGWSASFHNENNRYLLAKREQPQGDVYVLVYVMDDESNPVSVYEEVVEVAPMQGSQVSVLSASALQQGLDAEGKVAVYGVYFDTAKAEVKAESKPSLDEMAKLLNGNRALKVYIVGHTDNVGTLASNLDLSQRRAEAVVKALAGYKVDAQRMLAKGVASLAPVASNAAEASRARNRRVELVVQ